MVDDDWAESSLGNIFETVTGNTPSKKEMDNYGSELPFIKPPQIKNNILKNYSEFLSKKGKIKARILPVNSVLVTCIGNLGRIGMNKIEVAFNQQINAIKPLKEVEPKFTFYQAQRIGFKNQLEKLSTSTTVALVNKTSFNSVRFKIAPFPIQRAIVAKIEELFSSLDSGIADLKKAQEQLKVYRQAVLKKAFEGELTKEWREKQTNLPSADELLEQIKEERQKYYEQQLEDWKKAVDLWKSNGEKGKKSAKPRVSKIPSESLDEKPFELADNWQWSNLFELTAIISDGPFGSNLKGADYIDSGIRVVRLENIKSLEFDDSKKSFVSKEKYKSIIRHTVYPGEIIFSTFIADETKVVILPRVFDFAINKADCVRIKSFSCVSNKYLQYYLASRITYSLLVNQVHGATRPRVNSTQLKTLSVPICSEKEQYQIVKEIESRLSVCDQVELTIKQSLKKAEALRQSILKKAFEGKLLSETEIAKCKQAKDYEPASVLLERIKKERT